MSLHKSLDDATPEEWNEVVIVEEVNKKVKRNDNWSEVNEPDCRTN